MQPALLQLFLNFLTKQEENSKDMMEDMKGYDGAMFPSYVPDIAGGDAPVHQYNDCSCCYLIQITDMIVADVKYLNHKGEKDEPEIV